MHFVKVAEAKSTVHKINERTKIAGVLATPRFSRNDVLYFPEELAKQHGKIIPIDLNHDHNHSIGFSRLIWNKELQRLEYVGEITDHELESQLRQGVEYFTSLEGECEGEEVCSEEKCHTACQTNTNIERMAIVLEPGIPETSVKIIESKIKEPFAGYKDFDDCVAKNQDKRDPNAYCGEIKKKTESSLVDNKANESQKLSTNCDCEKKEAQHECPEGEVFDVESGKCVPKKEETFEVTPDIEKKLSSLGWSRSKKESEPEKPKVDPDSTLGKKADEVIKDAANKADDLRAKNPTLTGKAELETIINPVIEMLKVHNKRLGELANEKVKPVEKPIAEVGMPTTKLKETYNRVLEFFTNKEIPSIQWDIDKEEWLKERGYTREKPLYTISKVNELKKIAEAVTATSVPAITFQSRIILDPTDITRVAFRAYSDYQNAIPGTDRVQWHTGDAANLGFEAVTEGITFTDRTVTITQQLATLSDRFLGVKVGYKQVHDIPGGVMEFVNMVIALRAIADENSNIVGTGVGGFNESGFTPSNWVRGDGTVITTDDIVTNPLKRDGIVAAKRLIQAQGFETGVGATITSLAPKAHQDIMLDTNLNNYYQFAKPEITETGVLERVYGTDLAISTAVTLFDNVTNDQFRNTMWVKGVAHGLGDAGSLEFEASRRNEVSQIFVTGRHRVIGRRLLEAAAARISSED